MPNECWRKIQQREIVITNKDDIMTCVQENNLFKKLREILCIQTRKVMSTDKFRETALSPWLLNVQKSYFSTSFFGVPSQSVIPFKRFFTKQTATRSFQALRSLDGPN